MLIGFIGFLLCFLALGLLAARQGKPDSADYYLAGQSVAPWAVGLSGVATNNSGYMFIGMVGYTYTAGLSAVWLAVGLIVGDFLTSLLVHKRFRVAAEATGEVSYAGVLSTWGGRNDLYLRRVIAVISLIFLLAYASAQFSASAKLIGVMSDNKLPEHSGAYLAAAVIAAYCWRGGIRASIWTDVAQAALMMMTALLLCGALLYAGGFDTLQQIPGFLDATQSSLWLPGLVGGILFAVSWGFAGVCVIGQPHIMSRFMTLNHPDRYKYVRPWYYGFYILMYASVIGIGLLARAHLPELSATDPELAMPTIAKTFFSPLIAGLIVAGVFAAAMSTADSQIISCSSTLVRDLAPQRFRSSRAMSAATLISIGVALLFALSNNQSIFNLVIFAWSAMGSAFAPLLLVYAAKGRPPQTLAVGMVAVGLTTALGWRLMGWNTVVFEGMPAIMLPLLLYLFWHWKHRA